MKTRCVTQLVLVATACLCSRGSRFNRAIAAVSGRGGACPSNVKRNRRNECVDDDGIEVDDACCAQAQACHNNVLSKLSEARARLQTYMSACGVKQTDLQPNGDGSFALKDRSAVCSGSCQGAAELSAESAIKLGTLANDCRSDEDFEDLSRLSTLVESLDSAWANCGKTISQASTGDDVDLFEPDVEGIPAVVFVIDRSASMNSIACPQAGYDYTRYDFAVVETSMAVSKLKANQNFNVVVFDRSPMAMEEYPVPATQDNKEKMIAFLSLHGPREGFTQLWQAAASNPEKAIRLAFSQPGVIAVHLLGDGAPTDGATSATKIIHDEYNHVHPVPIHAVMFLPGVSSASPEKQGLQQLLQDLARLTGGSYKEPFPDMPKVCPVRVGQKMYVSEAGLSEVNGWWQQEGQTRGRPRYVKYQTDGMLWNGAEYIIEWSSQRNAWRLFKDNLFGAKRTTLYLNRENRHIMPIHNWITISGVNPPPTVEEYLQHMSHHA